MSDVTRFAVGSDVLPVEEPPRRAQLVDHLAAGANPLPDGRRALGWVLSLRVLLARASAWAPVTTVLAVLLVVRLSAVAPVVGLLLVAVTAVVSARWVRTAVRGADPHILPAIRDLTVVFSGAAFLMAVGVVPHADLAPTLAAVTAAFLAGLVDVRLASHGARPVRVMVVGDSVGVAAATARWAGRLEVVGALVLGDVTDDDGLPSVGRVATGSGLEDVLRCRRTWEPDVVLVAPGAATATLDLRRLSWTLEGSRVRLAVLGTFDGIAPHRVVPRGRGHGTWLEVAPSRPHVGVRVAKALVDRVAGTALLVLAAPLLAVLMLAVRLDSPGPAIFRQVRIGRDGRPFRIYKLRTMTVEAEHEREALRELDEGAGLLFKVHRDPRVTRVGALLRRTSLDELPQLVNVVRGEMSLVGPRPALPGEVAAYDERARRRLAVRPGMTGLWQVSGRSDLPWDVSVDLDLYYTDNWRVRDDVAIGLRTFGAVVGGRGAY